MALVAKKKYTLALAAKKQKKRIARLARMKDELTPEEVLMFRQREIAREKERKDALDSKRARKKQRKEERKAKNGYTCNNSNGRRKNASTTLTHAYYV